MRYLILMLLTALVVGCADKDRPLCPCDFDDSELSEEDRIQARNAQGAWEAATGIALFGHGVRTRIFYADLGDDLGLAYPNGDIAIASNWIHTNHCDPLYWRGKKIVGQRLFTLFLHEYGHQLGLGHSDSPDSVMAQPTPVECVLPSEEDIANVLAQF